MSVECDKLHKLFNSLKRFSFQSFGRDILKIPKNGIYVLFEKQVSKLIQNNFSFAVLPVKDKKTRLEIESKVISTVSLCDECKPSPKWFGLFSPKNKIRESGLWLINELYKTPIDKKTFKKLEKIIKFN